LYVHQRVKKGEKENGTVSVGGTPTDATGTVALL
jgi:hypothetical protein